MKGLKMGKIKLLTAHEARSITESQKLINKNVKTILDDVREQAENEEYFSVHKICIGEESDREMINRILAIIKNLGYKVTMLDKEGCFTPYKISWENACLN
jgi:tRNA G26 N,N-dimethylase Trm1